MAFENLTKTVYENKDGSDKTIPTIPTKAGAWDMEQITGKVNELATFIKQGYDISTTNPTKQYGLKDGSWIEIVGGSVDPKYKMVFDDTAGGINIQRDLQASEDLLTLDFKISIIPTSVAGSRKLLYRGRTGDAGIEYYAIEVNADYSVQIRRMDELSTNEVIKKFTTSFTADTINTFEIKAGVVTINGINQNVDWSGFDTTVVLEATTNCMPNIMTTHLANDAITACRLRGIDFEITDSEFKYNTFNVVFGNVHYVAY